MSPRRRKGGGPPPPRPPKRQVVGRKRSGGAGPSDGAVERAITTSLRRQSWRILDLTKQGIQRRGNDRSIIFKARIQRDDVIRRATIVAHLSDRRPPGGQKPMLVDGHRIYVWRYPSDPFLPGLPRVTSNDRVRQLLDDVGGPAGQPNLSRRVYRATRRAVIQADLLDDAEEVLDTVYFKVLGDRDLAKIAVRTQLLADQHRLLAPHLPVPALVAVLADEGILATANVPGKTLRKAILDDPDVPTPASIAGMTITMAGLQVPSEADPIRYADPTRHASTISEILPKERARVTGLVEACVVEGPLVTVHGDFHDGQILVENGEVRGLIDIDGIGQGHLAHDAGRVIAYVESIGDIDRADPVRVDGFVKGLLDVYADHLDDDVLGRAIGGAWVALATGPHRRQQSDWEVATVRRLDHAERWLRQVGAL